METKKILEVIHKVWGIRRYAMAITITAITISFLMGKIGWEQYSPIAMMIVGFYFGDRTVTKA